MKTLFYIIIIVLATTVSKSQNLVPNPSFESYTLCPNNGGQIESAIPWGAATINSSTDYFNGCSTNFNVPNCLSGFQQAHSGNAYAGLGFSYIGGQREYIQVQLSSPLIFNKIYYVEFYVNLHNENSWTYSCNNIAANLSTVKPFTSNTYDLQSLTPHIMTIGNPVINDTLNWTKVSGCYTAQGGEEYLTIGNFFDNTNTQTTFTITTSYAAYYFVDDVSVVEITGTCVTGVNELATNFSIEIYPNPTNGILNFKMLDAGKVAKIKITDVLGREVLVSDYKEQIDISNLEKGIYFVSVMQRDKTLVTKKIFKE